MCCVFVRKFGELDSKGQGVCLVQKEKGTQKGERRKGNGQTKEGDRGGKREDAQGRREERRGRETREKRSSCSP